MISDECLEEIAKLKDDEVEQKEDFKMPKYLDYVGSVARGVHYAKVDDLNRFVDTFCLCHFGKHSEELYKLYRMTECNSQAGYKGFFKYNRQQPVFDQQCYNESFRWMEHHFQPWMDESDLLSYTEIVTQMDKRTSPGFPWIKIGLTKREVLQYGWFWTYLLFFLQCCKWSEDQIVFFMNNVKFELRLLEKLLENKMRVFMGSPLEHVMITMMYCWIMNEKFYHTAGKHWSFVGATKYHRGIHILFSRLNKHPNAFSLDETAYDASLAASLLNDLVDFRWGCLKRGLRTKESLNVLRTLYREIIHSVTVCTEGEVFLKHTGNPSGSANTIVDNTLILYRLMAYAWLRLAPDDMKTQECFENNVEAALNGDDNLWTCSDKVVGWFNATTVAAEWKKIGIKAHTDPDIPEMYLPRKLVQCDFLCQNFKQLEDGTYVPYPDTEKIMCALAYGGKTQTSAKMTLLRALALRIESYFNDECRDTIKALIKYMLNDRAIYAQLQAPPIEVSGTLEPDFKRIMSAYFTDSEIMTLYLGNEGQSDSVDERRKIFDEYAEAL